MNDEGLTIESLFSDAGPFDEAAVVKALQEHITIQRSTNQVFFKNSNLSTEKKILAFGLARKLLYSKELVDTEQITASEFHELTKIKKGTVDPGFKALKDRGQLVGKGKYEIPNHKISEIIQLLEREK